MSNRIIKDFKGWSLLNEDNTLGIPSTSSLLQKTPPLNLTPGVIPGVNSPAAYTPIGQGPNADPLVNQVIAAGTAAQAAAATQAAAAKTKAATPVAATPIVPTPDLKTANAAALTRNDWAAIQAKLNAANLDLTNILNPQVSVNPNNNNKVELDIPKPNESRSMTRLYEEQLAPLVVDGLVGTKTIAAVADFVTKYNSKPENSTKQLPVDPQAATATTINPLVLAAIAAAIAAPTTQPPSGPTGPAAITGSVFGPSANITEADFTPIITKNTQGYDKYTYLEPTSLLLATAKQFKTATAGPGTNEANMIAGIKVCKSASDFYKLNAVIMNGMSGDIAYIINDELEDDNLAEVQQIKEVLGSIGVTTAFLEKDMKDAAGKVIGKLFKEKSFTITIPTGSEPATVFPPAVYAVAVEQLARSTGAGSILY